VISAILRKHSASEECGPETKVPLTLVEFTNRTLPETKRFFFLDVTRREILHLMLSVGPFDLGGNEPD